MAKNWTAAEAAEALYTGTQEEMKEIGNRFPVFTRTVCMANNKYLIDILKAIPKITARVVETGLCDLTDTEEMEEEVEEVEQPKKKETVKKATKKKVEPEEDEEETSEDDYENMTGAELYKLCCKRGISSKCKSRSKAALIEVLKNNDGGADEEEPEEDWEEDEEETKDPYAGKTAKELYMMCKERKIKAEPRKKPEDYVKLLKKDDAKKVEPEPEEDEDEDEWEI